MDTCFIDDPRPLGLCINTSHQMVNMLKNKTNEKTKDKMSNRSRFRVYKYHKTRWNVVQLQGSRDDVVRTTYWVADTKEECEQKCQEFEALRKQGLTVPAWQSN